VCFSFVTFAKELQSLVFYFWNFMFRKKNKDKKSTAADLHSQGYGPFLCFMPHSSIIFLPLFLCSILFTFNPYFASIVHFSLLCLCGYHSLLGFLVLIDLVSLKNQKEQLSGKRQGKSNSL